MTFIITLISLIIERFFHWSHLRHWRWFSTYQQWLDTRAGKLPSYVLLAVCIVPLMIVVGVINCVLAGWLYGVLKLIFGVLILMYCLGPNNLWLQVYTCIGALNKDDPKAAVDCARSAFGVGQPEDSQAFHQALTRAIFVKAYHRVFAVVFWFVIFGPLGAVMYRALTLCSKGSPLGVTDVAMKVQRILDWIPARIFTFIFALVGHFMNVFNIWKRSFKMNPNENDKILSDCGVAALDVVADNRLPEDGSAEKDALSLLDRVFIIWLMILAVSVFSFESFLKLCKPERFLRAGVFGFSLGMLFYFG